MGADYRHWLIPRPNDYRPAAESIEALVRALAEGRRIPRRPSPDYARIAVDKDEARLEWAVPDPAGLAPPIPAASYRLEIHVSDDYAYRTSAFVGPFATTACACGAPLLAGARLRRLCPACRRPFDPSSLVAEVRDPWTGEVSALPGGATSRFALVLEARGVPRGAAPDPEMLRVCERTLGTSLYGVGELV